MSAFRARPDESRRQAYGPHPDRNLGTVNIVLYSAITGTQSYAVTAQNEAASPNTIKATANCVAGPGLTATSRASRLPDVEELGALRQLERATSS